MEFFLDGAMTNGPVSVTAIGIFGTADDTPLICQSEDTVSIGPRDWYLDPDQESTASSDVIQTGGDRGWRRSRATTSDGFQQVLLRRVSASGTALEGVFTCQISQDSNPIRSLSILHPSELYNASQTCGRVRVPHFQSIGRFLFRMYIPCLFLNIK